MFSCVYWIAMRTCVYPAWSCRELAALVEDLKQNESQGNDQEERLEKASREMHALSSLQERKWPVVVEITDLVTKLKTILAPEI